MTTIRLHTRQRKKSFLFLGLALLAVLIGEIILLPPQGILPFVFFFLLLFGGLFYLLSFIFNHSRPALIISIGLTFYIGLRFLGLHHWLYPLLIGAIIIAVEFYQRQKPL